MKGLAPFFALILLAAQPASAQPVPPCTADASMVLPAYGDIGGPPAVATWQDIELGGPVECWGSLRGRMALVVALAGRFDGARSLAAIAARFGAISASDGLLYWSTTDQRWRPLIAQAFAVDDPQTLRRRSDFTAAEILSGRTLYFAQDDTRSTGRNIYSLTAREVGPDRLVVEIVNLTTIRFALLTLFEPRALRSRHFIERQAAGDWRYYGVSAVVAGAVAGHEGSFVNRAGAFYRFLIGAPGDAGPPLAP